MNKVILKIKEIINNSINQYLPNVKNKDLEDNGAIYYMNGNNGTEFDWYVNQKLSNFMVFYNDKDNLGAVKLIIHSDCNIYLYIYDERGKHLFKEIKDTIDVNSDELFKLAIALKNEADDKRIFDGDISKIDTDIAVTNEMLSEFKSHESYYDNIKKRKELLNKMAYVSKRIINDNYKIGYMHREEPLNNEDSGWSFVAGNESDDYINNSDNIVLLKLYEVILLEPSIEEYLEYDIGTTLIRISKTEFEIDNKDKEIFVERRDN